jgi:hypothetical protein
MNNEMEYVKNQSNYNKIVRTELLLMPILVIIPLIVGSLLIYDWYVRGLLKGSSLDYFGELLLGIIILFVNILFDIPFLKSLKELSKKKFEE